MINTQNMLQPQINDYFCGPTCLQYAIKKLRGVDVSQYQIADAMNLTYEGADDEQMVKGANAYQLWAGIVTAGDITQYLIEEYVVVIGWVYPPDMEHYAILLELNAQEDRVVISDQWDGLPMIITLRYTDFIKLWKQTTVVVLSK